MPQYMLSVIHDWDAEAMAASVDDISVVVKAVDEFNAELQAAGQWVFAGGLQHPDTATVVDGAKGANTVTDGPYLEAKEHLGGFWIVEAPDLDAAKEIARRGSAACQGPVEVRPFQDEPPTVD